VPLIAKDELKKKIILWQKQFPAILRFYRVHDYSVTLIAGKVNSDFTIIFMQPVRVVNAYMRQWFAVNKSQK
jgi:hypothetical protein